MAAPTNPVYAEAFKYLLFAQQLYPDHYADFVKDLGIKEIPFSYTNPQFLETLVDFSERFKTHLQEAKVPESQIESVVPREVLEPLVAELETLPASVGRVKRERVEEITTAYVASLKRSVGRLSGEDVFKRNLTEDVFRLSQEAKNPQTLQKEIATLLTQKAAASSTDPEAIRRVAEPIARETVADAEKNLPALMADIPEEDVTRAVVESRVKRKDLWIKVYTQKASREARPQTEEVNRLAAVAEALQATPRGENLTSPTVFFQAGAKGLQKPFAALADAALTVFPKTYRDQIIESVTGRTWELATRADELNRNFGQAIVESALFQEVLQKGNTVFGKGQPSAARGLANAGSDLVSSIFGKPPTAEDLLVLVELGIIKSEYITGYQQLYVAGAHGKRSGLFGLVFNEAAGWGIQKGAGALAAKAGASWFGRLMGMVAGAAGGPITSALGAIFGGALFSKAGSFLSSLFGRRQASKPQLWALDGIMLPLVVVLSPIVLIVLLFSMTHIITTGALQEPDTGGGEQGSLYITLAKSPNPSSFPANNATSVTYTISVKPTNPGDTLEVTEIRDEFTVLAKTGEPEISSPEISPADVAGGKEFSYTVALGPRFNDSLIANTLTVVANVGGHADETKSISASVIVGNPPTECFEFGPGGVRDSYGHTSSAWDDRGGVMAAIAILGKSKPYMVHVCSRGTVMLHRVKADFGGGSVNSDSDIFLYDAGVRGTSAVYTLAHETGHIVDHRTDLADQFRDQGISQREGYIWTYPNSYSEGEDFAETFGVYPVYKSYTFRKRGKKLNYPQEYSLHYEFAKGVFGIEY